MQIMRWFPFLIVLLTPAFVLAQNADNAVKEKQRRQSLLVEQILADITNLKLSENRAFVYAKIGNIIWKNDPKRARALFQNAVGELINAQMYAEANKKNTQYLQDLLMGQSTRPQILNTIAARDAEFALECLYRTRPVAVEKALAGSTRKTSKISNSSPNYAYLAQNELNLEQSLTRLAADQNPERAVKLLKEALKKGLSGETLNLLGKLNDEDPTAASEISGEVVNKLLSRGLTENNQPDYQIIGVSTAFLSEFIRTKTETEKALRFDESQMKALAAKLISFHVEQSSRYDYLSYYSIVQIAEKLAPGAVEQLKKLEKNNPRRGFHYEENSEVNKLMTSNPTSEQLLAEAKRFPVESRGQIYQAAANKIAQAGDMNSAVAVLNDNFSDDAFENAINSLNWYYATHLMNQGQFTDAERLIDEFPDSNRHAALISLANSVFNINRVENKSYAVALLGKVRAQISGTPENSNEMSNLMQVISAYSNIEPTEAFRSFEPLIPQLNEISEASVIVNGFQGGSSVRQGEYLMTQGNFCGFYVDLSALGTLAEKEFDRTMNLIDGFTRREIRITLKLQLVERSLN